MDKEKALQILKLDAGATLAQAKQAFRHLAKQYHPDVCVRQDQGDAVTDDRMAQINLAYKYLGPILASEAAAAETAAKREATGGKSAREKQKTGREKQKPAREKQNSVRKGTKKKGFSSSLDELFSFFSRKTNRPPSGKKTGPAKTRPKSRATPRNSRRGNPGGSPRTNSHGPDAGPARFNEVFSHLNAAPSNGMTYRRFVSKGTGRIRSSQNFQACMALKRRINQVRARRSDAGGRISRIEPVTPVNPVEKT